MIVGTFFIALSILIFIVTGGSNAAAVADFNSTAATWTKVEGVPPSHYVNVVTDSSGKTIATLSRDAGELYTGFYLSQDAGKTWSNIFIDGCAMGPAWTAIAMNTYGTAFYILQENIGIYSSWNTGKSWTRTTIDPKLTYAGYNGVAAADTNYVYVTLPYGGIYYSSNNAYSFSKSNAPTTEWWMGITSSKTGQYVIAYSHNMYFSNNYGVTWSKASAPAQNWFTAHYSYGGMVVVAAAETGGDFTYGGLYYSIDSGKTWITLTGADPNQPWRAVTTDYTGTFIAAAIEGGAVYYSNNSGKSFVKSSTAPEGETWTGISCDQYATAFALVSYGSNGNVYVSSNGI